MIERIQMQECMLIVKPTEDGKDMNLDVEKLGIKGVMEEVDRHSRQLLRQESLTGN